MKTLFTCVPGFGHLLPLLPLANALVAAGHDVAIATGADLRPQAAAAGFTAFSAGIGVSEAFQQLAQRFPDRIFDRLAPAEILHWYLRHLFGETIAPAMLADLED